MASPTAYVATADDDGLQLHQYLPGVQDVKLVFVNGNVNVDWLQFSGTRCSIRRCPRR
ncbi:hypothetical protein ACPFP2_00725 [Micromonospora citrea]|uniref:hypothetical protein n=1 Tax=Micromonospora citrea TaxID=47855 RepID=UPI003C3FE7CF